MFAPKFHTLGLYRVMPQNGDRIVTIDCDVTSPYVLVDNIAAHIARCEPIGVV